ncbi:MAG: hypothetical protein M0Z46_23565 [Actinomycetota bacterium]|jgi:hypothetical protein|nr:hypothetical protein [Actinomycetota bacterium]
MTKITIGTATRKTAANAVTAVPMLCSGASLAPRTPTAAGPSTDPVLPNPLRIHADA